MEKHPLHIKNPELQTSPEVKRAVARKEKESSESIPNDPSDRIEAYAERLENIFLNEDEETRKRNLELFRDKIYSSLLIKEKDFPESYFELQQRIARERGQAVEVIPEETRNQMKEVAIQDQKASLDAWMDYLTSDDAVYPAWFKYYVWKNITKLSQFDKERGEYKKRTKTTVAPFPDIYREPLAQIADIYEKVKSDNKNLKEPEIQEAFSKKFPDLYAELTTKSLAASMENREEIRGEWVKYEQGKEGAAEKLFASLEGKGTGWCTAGQSTAKSQIERGDFHVYYSYDSKGEPTLPRLAIRMEGKDRIGEVRGILPNQGVESLMQQTLDEKLNEFGTEADSYRKKSEDMRLLTELEKKHERGEPFTKDDLVFLYEVNSDIEGFGYKRDPRIAELRQGRKPENDILVAFECTKDQIARTSSEITENTKVYVGQLESDIFQKFPETLNHIYTSFPDKRIVIENIRVGDKSSEKLISDINATGVIKIHSKNIDNILDRTKTIIDQNPEDIKLINLTIRDLGFEVNRKNSPSFELVLKRAKELGLELCPPDTGLHWHLKHLGEVSGFGPICVSASNKYRHPFYLTVSWNGTDIELSSTNGIAFAEDKSLIFRTRKIES